MENLDIAKIRQIEGLENFVVEKANSNIQYIKILSGNTAAKHKKLPGTIVISNSNEEIEVLAQAEKEFIFMPIAYFTDWTIWDSKTNKPIKKSLNKTGVWSDGTPILPEQTSWVDGMPPIATEALNFIILPVSKLKDEEEKMYLLSFGFTNKIRVEKAKSLLNLIAQTSIEKNLKGMRHGAYSVQTELVSSDNNSWYEFSNAKFIKEINEDTKQIVDAFYPKAKKALEIQALLAVDKVNMIDSPKEKEQEDSKKGMAEVVVEEDALF